jgi:phospholipase C
MRFSYVGRRVAAVAAVAAAVGTAHTALAWGAPAEPRSAAAATSTPIRHVVVVFQENVSFDHYFATYPDAVNPVREPAFTARPGTPSVNGLGDSLRAPNNPNSTQPFRLGAIRR